MLGYELGEYCFTSLQNPNGKYKYMSSVEVYSKYFGEFGVDIAQYIKTTQKEHIELSRGT